MRSLSLFLFFSCILTYACCRPGKCELQAVDQAEESEDYREEDEGAANYDPGQQDNEEQANENDHEETELQPQSKQSEVKYKENHDDSEKQNAQCAYNEAIDAFKQNLRTADRNRVNKRSETNAVNSRNDEGDLLFENYLRNQQKSNGRIAFNNRDENQDLGEQSRYYRRYYNTNNRKQMRGNYEAASANLNRNRREVPKAAITSNDNVNLKDQLETQISSEEEEAAIKRHVKKLSSNELEQLLNSLSDDKRNLLKKIIDNESESSLIKREITKKAGAVEENNLMESGPLQSVSPLTVSSDSPVSQNTEAPETAKQSENVSSNDLFSGQSVDTTSENKANVISSSDEKQQLLNTINGEHAHSVSTGAYSSVQDVGAAASTKSTNKREAHSDDYNANPNETADKTCYGQRDSEAGYLASQEDDSPDAEDNESAEEPEMPRKREVSYQKYSELSDSEKSLEESFPNSKAYEDSDPYAASDMLPLVRVKRKNMGSVPALVKKRAAAIMPDAKVGFVPYKAENDDEDNDEANEFDDNGFYDRTSNLKVNDMSSKIDRNSAEEEVEVINDEPDKKNLRDDKANLGSDTDGVLAGVGVDENMMFSKQNSELVAQNSDVVECNDSEETNQIRVRRSVPDEVTPQKVTGTPVNAPIYHEIDSFGPLLQDPDTETSRFKRIRRVKPLSDSRKTNP